MIREFKLRISQLYTLKQVKISFEIWEMRRMKTRFSRNNRNEELKGAQPDHHVRHLRFLKLSAEGSYLSIVRNLSSIRGV